MPSTVERAATALRDTAMSYPEAHEDFPWGEVAVKVNKKVFLFMHGTAETLGLSCKLPHSSDMALMLPFAKPTGYGLGKSGWVSASFTAKEQPPLDLLREWIDESYRAVAPKKLVAALAGARGQTEEKAASPKVGKKAASAGAKATSAKVGKKKASAGAKATSAKATSAKAGKKKASAGAKAGRKARAGATRADE